MLFYRPRQAIANAQLQLPQANQIFRQDNPTPSITSILVTPSGTNSIQVIIIGQPGSLMGQAQQDSTSLTLRLMHVGLAATSGAKKPSPIACLKLNPVRFYLPQPPLLLNPLSTQPHPELRPPLLLRSLLQLHLPLLLHLHLPPVPLHLQPTKLITPISVLCLQASI
ncbi:MAG: hypothetical protein LH647_00360 [Leptolyngbyaceae cyanobacterium CAN_BIN12]|nr:hypothetical protein [Leptolyngbyaceae cyanobacterium CAN_BIN12]